VLDELFDRYWPRVVAVVRYRVRPDIFGLIGAEDIVQDTFGEALRGLSQFEVRDDASFIRWLSKIAERQIISATRKLTAQVRDRRREKNFGVGLTDRSSVTEWSPIAPGEGIPDQVASKELLELVDQALGELPPAYREVILLRDFMGGSWEYVTRELGRDNPDATCELHRRARIRWTRLVGQTFAMRPPR
jgi:RNA polymerase sigma factor (sigma-70 family)